MKPERIALAEYRLEKAGKTLADAKTFFNEASSASIKLTIF